MKFNLNKNLPILYLFVFILFAILMGLSPKYRYLWFVENIILIIFLIILIISYKYFKFSNLSYSFIFLFCIFQTIGAHYSYAEVPFGFWLAEIFDFERNNYDRIVHFMYGFLLSIPIRELFIKSSGLKKGFWTFFIPITIIFSTGAFYEILEWTSTFTILPVEGDANLFLGSQGDVWDAEKDMFLAGLGSIIIMFLNFIFLRFKKSN